MNVEEFENLSDAQRAIAFGVVTASLDGQRTNVNIERTLLRYTDPADEITAWASRNAAAAQHLTDNGTVRHAGGTLVGRWTFVYLIRHRDGAVTILNAAVSAPSPR
jgi:hypothetical protein